MHPRKTLLVLNSIQLIFFAAFTLFVFLLPSNQERISSQFDNFDLFYKFVFKGAVGFLTSEYVSLGTVLFILTLLSLISLLIVHGNFRKVYVFSLLYYFLIIIIFPVGTILGLLSLFLLYVLYEDYKPLGKAPANLITNLDAKIETTRKPVEPTHRKIMKETKLLVEDNAT